MVDAFRVCQNECLGIQQAVNGARDRLGAHWQSDQAAPAFGDALDQWLIGFQRVRQGLDMLEQNMRDYTHLTASAEDLNTAQARRGAWD